MDNVKRSLLTLAAIGVLALGTMAFGGAGTNDYSSGFGYWNADNASVGYTAQTVAPGTNLATGQFDYRAASRDGQGKGFHAVIDCLEVDGERAWVRLEVTESTHPDHAPGDTLIAYAEDNGDGHGDAFDLREEDDDLFNDADCDRDDDDEGTAIRGDIVVEEGGFAGGRD